MIRRGLLFLFSFCPATVFAEIVETHIVDLSGGLNTTTPAHKLSAGQSPFLMNVLGDEKIGSLVTVGGFVELGSTMTLKRGDGGFPFFLEDGTKKFVVTDSSIVMTTKDFQTYVVVSTANNDSALMRCAQIRNKMWCSNGINPVFTIDENDVVVKLDGSNNTPNVPLGKYPAYDQERVWLFNLPNAGSALRFTRLTASTDGAAIAPDDIRAWPSENQLNVGQGDGQVGTALFVSNGQLFAGKENSIYAIYGENETNYFDKLILKGVGVASNDSVVNLDGNFYFLGQSGIYEGARRISDDIRSEVDSIIKVQPKTVRNKWDAYADFRLGTQVHGSTLTPAGLVTTVNDTFTFVNASAGPDYPGTAGLRFDTTNTWVVTYAIRFSSENPAPDSLWFIGGPADVQVIGTGVGQHNDTVYVARSAPSGCTADLSTKIRNTRTDQSETSNNGAPSTSISSYVPNDLGYTGDPNKTPVTFTGDDLLNDRFEFTMIVASDPACYYVVAFPTHTSRMVLTSANSGQFTSDVATIATLTAWGTFDAGLAQNQGTVGLYYRTSTSAVNISTQLWASITPGAKIGAPTTHKYIQWASTISSPNRADPATLDFVNIDHFVSGSSNERAIGASWKNRFWLAVATEVGGNFSVLYVKSRITSPAPDAWWPIYGVNIRSLFKDNEDYLYAGSASTGTFYRLDYGTNFDGKTIVTEYQTPDMVLGDNFRDKRILKYLVDVDKKSGATLKIGTSIEGRAFNEVSRSIDGSGRKLMVVEGVTNIAKYLRLRFRNDELDKGMTLHGVGIQYEVTDKLK